MPRRRWVAVLGAVAVMGLWPSLASGAATAAAAPAPAPPPHRTLPWLGPGLGPAARSAVPGAAPARRAAPAAPRRSVARTVYAVSDSLVTQSETAIAADPAAPGDLIAGSNNPEALGMSAYGSSDGGATWTTTTLPLTDSAHESGAFASDPSVAWDVYAQGADRAFFASILVNSAVTPTAASVVVAGSADGMSWSGPPVAVDRGLTGGYIDDKPYLAADNWPGSPHAGNLYVAWTYNSLAAGEPQIIELSTSTAAQDGGAWSQPVQVSAPSESYVLYAEPVAAPDGSVYVIWDDYGVDAAAGQSAMMVAHCTTFGAGGAVTGCGTPVKVADSNVNLGAPGPVSAVPGACDGNGSASCYAIPAQPDRGIAAVPSLAVGAAGTVYAVWTTAPSPGATSTQVVFARSTDGGASWSSPARLDTPVGGGGTDYDFFPWLTRDPANGLLAVSFYSTRGDPQGIATQVYVTASSDGGLVWSPERQVSTVASDEASGDQNLNDYGDYEGTAALAGIVYPVWTQGAASATVAESVYTAAVPVGSTAGRVAVAVSPLTVAPGGQVTVSGAVYDWVGDGVPGVSVSLSSSLGGLAADVTSGAGGAFGPVSYTVPSTAPAGPFTVTASVNGPLGAAVSGSGFAFAEPAGAVGPTVGASGSPGPGGATGGSVPGLTVTGTGGPGAWNEWLYPSDPVGPATFNASPGFYFDVTLSPGSAFTLVTIAVCNLHGGNDVYWWNPAAAGGAGAWSPASRQSLSGSCVDVTVDSGSSPSLAELGGTVFAVGVAAAVGGGGGGGGGGGTAGGPVILGVSPNVGPSVGGTPVTVSGVGFTGATTVDFGPTPAESLTVQSDQSLVAVSPPGSGTVDITVSGPDGSSGPTPHDRFTYQGPAPVTVGAQGGSLITPDEAFALEVPAGALAAGATLALAESAQPPAGLPAGLTAVSPAFVLVGGSLNPPQKATIRLDAAALGTLSPHRVAIYRSSGEAGGTWSPLPTAVDPSGASVAAYVYAPGTYAAAAASQRFSDVPAGYWARPDIDAALAAGVVNGFPDGTFRPGAPVTRAEFVKMLLGALALPPAAPGPASAFADVPPAAWFAPYVAAGVAAGLIQGVSATAFDPQAGITREQMATLLGRALNVVAAARVLPATAAATAMASVPVPGVDPWAQTAVQRVTRLRIMVGLPGGGFDALGGATRAQAAAVLARLLSLEAASPPR